MSHISRVLLIYTIPYRCNNFCHIFYPSKHKSTSPRSNPRRPSSARASPSAHNQLAHGTPHKKKRPHIPQQLNRSARLQQQAAHRGRAQRLQPQPPQKGAPRSGQAASHRSWAAPLQASRPQQAASASSPPAAAAARPSLRPSALAGRELPGESSPATTHILLPRRRGPIRGAHPREHRHRLRIHVRHNTRTCAHGRLWRRRLAWRRRRGSVRCSAAAQARGSCSAPTPPRRPSSRATTHYRPSRPARRCRPCASDISPSCLERELGAVLLCRGRLLLARGWRWWRRRRRCCLRCAVQAWARRVSLWLRGLQRAWMQVCMTPRPAWTRTSSCALEAAAQRAWAWALPASASIAVRTFVNAR